MCLCNQNDNKNQNPNETNSEPKLLTKALNVNTQIETVKIIKLIC